MKCEELLLCTQTLTVFCLSMQAHLVRVCVLSKLKVFVVVTVTFKCVEIKDLKPDQCTIVSCDYWYL